MLPVFGLNPSISNASTMLNRKAMCRTYRWFPLFVHRPILYWKEPCFHLHIYSPDLGCRVMVVELAGVAGRKGGGEGKGGGRRGIFRGKQTRSGHIES